MKPIAVLGAGPAGLLAAHAVGLAGQPIVIFSVGGKSRLGGAQFLHSDIPELTPKEPDAVVTYVVKGSHFVYQQKAYGSGAQPSFVSFSNVKDGQQQPAWNLQKMYDELWRRFEPNINEVVVDAEWIQENHKEFALVISSVPRPSLCSNEQHRWTRQEIIIDPRPIGLPDMTVYYDGTSDHSWYRSSNLWGCGGREWGTRAAMQLPYDQEGFVSASKPLDTNCNCLGDINNLVRIGRYGRWEKGVLVHDGFERTIKQLHARKLLRLPDPNQPGVGG